jgi:hypothetical protein
MGIMGIIMDSTRRLGVVSGVKSALAKNENS